MANRLTKREKELYAAGCRAGARNANKGRTGKAKAYCSNCGSRTTVRKTTAKRKSR